MCFLGFALITASVVLTAAPTLCTIVGFSNKGLSVVQ